MASQLSLWTQWNMTTPLPFLGNCTNSMTREAVPCAEACFAVLDSPLIPSEGDGGWTHSVALASDSNALWDPFASTNLAICGLWWTVAMGIHWNISVGWLPDSSNHTIQSADEIASEKNAMLTEFAQLGLELPEGGFSTRNIPDLDCFVDVASYKASGNALGSNDLAPWCSPDVLFGYQSLQRMQNNTKLDSSGPPNPISACLNSICSPKSPLNPDLGGIGVFVSFMMQSSITIVSFLALLYFHNWPVRNGNARRKKNTETLITAVIDFHRAQCYFAGSIQIATLIFASGQSAYHKYGNDDYTNDELFFIIATNGYIPVVFTLTYIFIYGTPSWHLTLLSLCSLALSTGTLFQVHRIFVGIPDPNEYATSWVPLSEDCFHNIRDIITAWCPSKTSSPELVSINVIVGFWNWIIWAICVLWLLYCVSTLVKPSAASIRQLAKFPRVQATALQACKMASQIYKLSRKLRLFYLFFPLSWAVAFGYQFFGFIIFFTHSEIANNWSFGQIVAITVWAPCLAEFIYLQRHGMTKGSQYRLPRTLKVVSKDQLSSIPHPAVNPKLNDGSQTTGVQGVQDDVSTSLLSVLPSSSTRDVEMRALVQHSDHV